MAAGEALAKALLKRARAARLTDCHVSFGLDEGSSAAKGAHSGCSAPPPRVPSEGNHWARTSARSANSKRRPNRRSLARRLADSMGDGPVVAVVLPALICTPPAVFLAPR